MSRAHRYRYQHMYIAMHMSDYVHVISTIMIITSKSNSRPGLQLKAPTDSFLAADGCVDVHLLMMVAPPALLERHWAHLVAMANLLCP
jgi:hypothetical protein